MKKSIVMTALAAVTLLPTSCTKDKESDPIIKKDSIVGKWRIKKIQVKDKLVDVTKQPYSKYLSPIYAMFNDDGTYVGKGYFGNGEGTYKAEARQLVCYVHGEVYATYYVLKVTGKDAHLKMTINGQTFKIECVKEDEVIEQDTTQVNE